MSEMERKHKRIEAQHRTDGKRYRIRIPDSRFDDFNGTSNNPIFLTSLEKKDIEEGSYDTYGLSNSTFVNRVLDEYSKVINHTVMKDVIKIFRDNGYELSIQDIDKLIHTLNLHKRAMEMHKKELIDKLVSLNRVSKEPFVIHSHFDNWTVRELEDKLRQEEGKHIDRDGNYTFPKGYKPHFLKPYEM